MHSLFIDESFSKNYIMVGHLVETNRVGQLRKAIRSHVLSGQRSIHFVKESNSRRKYLLSQFHRLGCQTIKAEVAIDDLKSARLKALETLIALSGEFQILSFVFELDETTFLSDKAALERHNLGVGNNKITFDFKARHEEPLLWLADAVAWSLGRGGVWKSRVESLVISANPDGD